MRFALPIGRGARCCVIVRGNKGDGVQANWMTILLAALAAVVPTGTTFTCTPIRVCDGDGPV
jgi:hypothetical protein